MTNWDQRLQDAAKFNNLIVLKFGERHGAAKRVAEFLKVDYQALMNMRHGRRAVPQDYIAQLDALPNYQPEDRFSVVNIAGDTRINMIVPADTVERIDELLSSSGQSFSPENAERVLLGLIDTALDLNDFEAQNETEENPLA